MCLSVCVCVSGDFIISVIALLPASHVLYKQVICYRHDLLLCVMLVLQLLWQRMAQNLIYLSIRDGLDGLRQRNHL